MPRGDQLSRQWRLLELIDRPAGVTIEQAARELRCNKRTAWRDVRVLGRVFPIYDDKSGNDTRTVFRLTEDFKRRIPLRLSLAELAALVMSRELLAPLGASVLGPAVASAFDRITAVMSKDMLALLERMREVVGVRMVGAKLQDPAANHVPAIQMALVERRRLRIGYHAFHRDEETDREIDPYHLTYFAGGIYLIAHCHLRKAVRIFAVERIRSVTPLSRRFDPPKGFEPQKYLDRAWGILQGDLVTVRVIFAPALARYIRERLWHPSQKFRDLPDGRVELALDVADTLEVRRWILGFGPQAEVVEPESLRETLRAEAAALAERLAPRRRPLAASPREGSSRAREGRRRSR